MLEIIDINVHFGVIHALKGISLRVDDGEIVTLIGGTLRRQNHDAAYDIGHKKGHQRDDSPKRPGHHRQIRARPGEARHFPGAGRPPHIFDADGA